MLGALSSWRVDLDTRKWTRGVGLRCCGLWPCCAAWTAQWYNP